MILKLTFPLPPRSLLASTVALVVTALAALVALPSDARALGYLEHTYFGDFGCAHAQRLLAEELSRAPSTELASRYLALSLACPSRWESTYCVDGYKRPHASLHPRVGSTDYPVTLGDLAALPDHISRFGPVRRLPRAGRDGLLAQAMAWLVGEKPGGVIADVGEDACESAQSAPWAIIEADVEQTLSRLMSEGGPRSLPEDVLAPMAREAAPQGANDPAGRYSFDNPHYLDLVLRNHTHFGREAYDAWLGFHSVATRLAGGRCVDNLGLGADTLEELADWREGWDEVDWHGLSEEARSSRGCAMLREALAERLRDWSKRAAPERVAPAASWLLPLRGDDDGPTTTRQVEILDATLSALMALVFEGSGLHFLQDGLAAGHMRTIRSRESLSEVRHDHDADNRDGVVAITTTQAGPAAYVAWGDGFLLGPALPGGRECDWEAMLGQPSLPPAAVTNCLIQHQRGLIVAATSASLVDWALGGTLYGRAVGVGSPQACAAQEPLYSWVCAALPVEATVVTGEGSSYGRQSERHFHHAVLPVPPPPFSYESLTVQLGYDVLDVATQLGLRFAMLQELDQPAHWLTSWRVGLTSSFGEADDQAWFLDGAYAFHFRWSARFTLDFVPFLYAGLRELDGDDGLEFFSGAGPSVGFTALPEGWIKLPLEVGLAYRLPLNILTSDGGFFGSRVVEGHWIQLSLGLAFMH